MRSRGKRSMPAGTGVCGGHRAGAHGRERLVEGQVFLVDREARMRSTPRKPAWPSLVWNTSGAAAPVAPQ